MNRFAGQCIVYTARSVSSLLFISDFYGSRLYVNPDITFTPSWPCLSMAGID